MFVGWFPRRWECVHCGFYIRRSEVRKNQRDVVQRRAREIDFRRNRGDYPLQDIIVSGGVIIMPKGAHYVDVNPPAPTHFHLRPEPPPALESKGHSQ